MKRQRRHAYILRVYTSDGDPCQDVFELKHGEVAATALELQLDDVLTWGVVKRKKRVRCK